MHVFGSLIFLGPAFLASDTVGRTRKFLLAFGLVAVTFASGRDALLICVALGLAAFLAFRFLDALKGRAAFGAIALVVMVGAMACFTEIGSQALDSAFEKISGEGGTVRQEQRSALLAGISESWGLGAGHTAQVNYVRSVDKPWKYELLHLATLYHVGIYRRRSLHDSSTTFVQSFLCASPQQSN